MSDPELSEIDSLTETQVRELHALYQREWWTRGRSLEQTRGMLRHTDFLFGLCDRSSGHLAGFARVLTDRVFKAFIFDVIVAEGWRRRGLGATLMRRILEHPDLTAVRHFELACRKELVPFYGRFGFTTEVGGILLMRRSRPD